MATVNKNEVYWLEQIANILAGGGNLPVLAVEGYFTNYCFTPREGQPTYAEAAAHYMAGGTVLVKVVFNYDEGVEVYSGLVVAHYTEGKLLFALPDNMNDSGGAAKIYFWNDPDN